MDKNESWDESEPIIKMNFWIILDGAIINFFNQTIFMYFSLQFYKNFTQKLGVSGLAFLSVEMEYSSFKFELLMVIFLINGHFEPMQKLDAMPD